MGSEQAEDNARRAGRHAGPPAKSSTPRSGKITTVAFYEDIVSEPARPSWPAPSGSGTHGSRTARHDPHRQDPRPSAKLPLQELRRPHQAFPHRTGQGAGTGDARKGRSHPPWKPPHGRLTLREDDASALSPRISAGPRFRRLAQLVTVHQAAIHHHQARMAQVADVLGGIALDQGQIRVLADGDRTGLVINPCCRWPQRWSHSATLRPA